MIINIKEKPQTLSSALARPYDRIETLAGNKLLHRLQTHH